MEILDAPEVSTQEWVGGVRLHQPADWSDVSPEIASNRGKRWNHDPSDRPWLDKDDAEQSIASLCQRGLITSSEGRLLVQFATDSPSADLARVPKLSADELSDLSPQNQEAA